MAQSFDRLYSAGNESLKTALLEELEESSIQTGMSQKEIQGIESALDAIDEESQQVQEAEGLSQISFFLGVVNVPILCFTLAWKPGYFWVLYCAECIFLLPQWLYTVHKVYRGALFALDFCWVVNGLATIYTLLLLFDVFPQDLRRGAFITFSSVAFGPLAWACIALHNGLVFHSVEKMATVTIHMLPLIVALSILDFNDQVQEAFPGRFPTRAELDEVSLTEIYWYGMIPYLVWLILHTAWLLKVGLYMPDKGYATVFDSLYKREKLKSKFQQWFRCSSLESHAVIYLCAHCINVAITFLWSMLCFVSIRVHQAFGILVFASAAWCGAGYYEYMMARRYLKVLKELLAQKEKQRARRKGLEE